MFQGFVNSGYGVNGIAHVSMINHIKFYMLIQKCKQNEFQKYLWRCFNEGFYLILQNTGPAPSPLGQMPPNDGMPGGPIPPGFFPVKQ